MRIDKIEDDGEKFILHGENIYNSFKDSMDNIGLGISVTKSKRGDANVLYTKNNRDLVLKLIKERKED